MASRTPIAAGLATAPSELSELSAHRYWGRYATTALLPNAAGNAASDPAWSRLRAGDVAFVVNNSLYVCMDPGTLGGANATWMALGGGASAVQTIRSSYTFVVGQQGTMQVLAAQGDPPMPTNNANLDPTPVGPAEIEGVTVDYLDPGNGTELDQALLAAGAAPGGLGVDIRLRTCNINMADSVAPFVLPARCRLIGVGKEASSIIGNTSLNGASQKMFLMGNNRSALIGLNLRSPAPAGIPPTVTRQYGIIQGAGEVRDCRIQLDVSTQINRWDRYCIGDQSGSMKVYNCVFVGGNGWTQPTPSEVGCIYWGEDTYALLPTITEPGLALGNQSSGFNVVAAAKNCSPAPSVDDWYARDVSAPAGALRYEHDYQFGGNWLGGSWRNVRIEINNYNRVGQERYAFAVFSTRLNVLRGHDVSACAARFATATMQTTGMRIYGTGNLAAGRDGGVRYLNVRGLLISGTGNQSQVGVIDYGVRTQHQNGYSRHYVRLSQVHVVALRDGGRGIWFAAGTDRSSIVDCVIGNEGVTTATGIYMDQVGFGESSSDNQVANVVIRGCATGIDTDCARTRISNVNMAGLTTNGVIFRANADDSSVVNSWFNGAGNAVQILAGVNNAQLVANNFGGLAVVDAGVGTINLGNVP